MLSKRLRRRLRQIDDQPVPPAQPPPQAEPIHAGLPGLSRRRLVEQQRGGRETPPEAIPSEQRAIAPLSGSLEQLVPGRDAAGAEGSYWLVEHSVERVLPHGRAILASFASLVCAERACAGFLSPLAGVCPDQLVLLDTETGGLSSAPVFLVGMIVWPGRLMQEATVLQMLARDYAEERAVLAEAARLLQGRHVLMTYNGRAFDLPMMRERMTYHGLGACPEPPMHLDLLHEIRARFRGRWEDCRLRTLERHLCGRSRSGDIDGAQIPQAWHDFVHTGDAGRVAQIMEHNRLDLVTMLEVLPRLGEQSHSDS
ncbi:MAG: ribonuclease H-like domain-containing protein [Armatimonadota bacterium]